MMKMKKLNDKGMTLIEIIVCFVIVVVIVLSMLKVVNNYKDKQDIESYKSAIFTYKNTLTKTVWDDIIKHQGIVKYEDITSNYNTTGIEVEYRLYFRDGTTSKLTIFKRIVATGDVDRINEDNSVYYVMYGLGGKQEKFTFPSIYNVQFNQCVVNEIEFSGEGAKKKGKMIHIYIGIYNPDLQIGDKYNVLDIYTPDVSDYYYALTNGKEYNN